MKDFDITSVFSDGEDYIFSGGDALITPDDAERTYCERYLTVHEGAQFLDAAFILKDLKNVTLDFGGATLTLRGRIQPFIIDNCENITIKNVTVEYERSLFTELEVVNNTGKELVLRMKDKFPYKVEDGYFIPYGKLYEDRDLYKKGCMFIQAFDRITGEGKGLDVIYLGEEIIPEPSPPASNIKHIKLCTRGEYTVFFGEFPLIWDENTDIVLEHENRFKSSVAMLHSRDIHIENYRILNGCGMGFFALYCENISLEGVKLFRDERSHGIVTNSADGIHFVACKGKIRVTDSVFQGMIDDALNIHSNYYHLEKADGNGITAVRSSLSHALNAYSEVFAPGDTIAVYKGRTLEERGVFTLKSVQIISRWSVFLETDSAAVDPETGDIIENLSVNPEVFIKRCVFGKANSHLRFQSRGKILIEDCDFSMPVLLTGDMNYWDEASPCNDFTVKNCRFTSERGIIRIVPSFNPTGKAPYYHKNIRILNNTFTVNNPLEQHFAHNVIFEDNKTV